MRYLNKIIEYGVLLFVFLIPWQARWIIKGGEINGGYWEYGTASLYATEVLLVLILLGVIIKGAIWFKRNRSGFDWRHLLSPAGVLFLFVIWAGVSVFWSIDRGVAGQHLVFLILAAALFVIARTPPFAKGGGSLANARDKLRNHGIARNGNLLSWTIILSAAIQGAIALIQFFSQSIPGSTLLGMSAQSASALGASVIETIDGRWLRAYGTFPHPNILGGWLVLGLVLLMRNLFYHPESAAGGRGVSALGSGEIPRPRRLRLCGLGMTWTVAFVVILSGLLVTFSRAAWLAFVIALFFVIAKPMLHRLKQSYNRHKERLSDILVRRDDKIAAASRWTSGRPRNDIGRLIFLTIFVIAFFAALFPEPFFARLSSNNRLEIKSSQERAASLSQSWQIIKKYPLTGVGLGNYGLAAHRELDNTKPAWYYQPAHNVPLLIWSELGLIGFLLITFYLLLFTFKAHKGRFRLGLYLLPLLTLSFLDHYLWSLYPGLTMLAVWLSVQRHEP